ncbi:MAG TPA: Ig-like domain-containing protein [Candidatus Saccharimonadales bacterium]
MTAILTVGTTGLLTSSGAAAAGLAIDKQVSAHSASGTSTTAPTFSTAQTNELLVAFLSADGPSKGGSQTYTGVTGGGLTWKLRQRSNAQAGTAEIWTAVAAAQVNNVSVKATHSGSNAASITVVAFTGADTGNGVGVSAAASAASGAPSVALTTTKPGSWVWAAGTDWDQAQARTVGSAQTKVDEYLPSVGDTYWVQRQTNVTPAAGTTVTTNDIAPTSDRWDLAALEIAPAVSVPDTTPPSTPQNLAANAVGSNQVVLSWNASTDNSGVAPLYTLFRDGSASPLASNVANTTYTDNSAAPSTTYSYSVQAVDGSGNVSSNSNVATATTGTPDTTAPTVALTAPADGATVTGVTTVAATATDDVAVKNVQFKLTNLATNTTADLGAPLATSPYQTSWDTSTVANGQYALSAVAADTSGNTTTSTTVTVTVANTAPVVPTLDASTPAPVGVGRNISSVTTAPFSPPSGSVLYAALSLDQLPNQRTVVGSITNTGTQLNWQLLGRENHGNGGDVEVWWAYNANAQSGITVTTNFSLPSKDVTAPLGDFQVMVFNNAAADQSTAAAAINWNVTGDGDNHPTVTITPTHQNARVYAVFDNWNYGGQSIVPGTDQSITSEVTNTIDVDSYWIQQKNTPVNTPGTAITMEATLGGINPWHALAWEVVPAAAH